MSMSRRCGPRRGRCPELPDQPRSRSTRSASAATTPARDPRTVNLQHDAERIADIAVLQTWVNGRQVYQQAPLA